MTGQRICKLFLLLFIFISQIISAQERDTSKVYVLQETVVTGTRVQLKQNMLPASISVIDDAEILRSPEVNILPLINNSAPGIFINNRNVLGYGVSSVSSGEISIRGISESPNTSTLVLVNGQPQFMGLFGHPINDSYMSSDVERVEIIRGPASLLYGTNAAGGAINLITRKQKEEGFSARTLLSYGSFKTSVVSGSAGYRLSNLNVSASYNHSQTDGHRKDGDDSFNSNAVYTNVSYSLNNNFSLGIDANYAASRFYDPGPESSPRKNNYYNYNRGRGAVSFQNTFSSTSGAVNIFYNYGDHDFFDGWRSTDDMAGITVYQSYQFSSDNIITAGIEYKNYGGVPPAGAVRLKHDLKVTEIEGYSILQLSPFSNFFLNAGVRGTKNSVYGFEYTPQAGFSYILDAFTSVRANAGKSFRSPSIADLFLFPVSNENLKPERIWSYEAGITRYLLNNIIKGDVALFYIQADNIIQPSPSLRGKKLNSGSFISKGVEATLSIRPADKFNGDIYYTYLNINKVLPYAPEHKLNFHLEYAAGIFLFSSDVQTILNLYPEGSTSKEDYTTISLTAEAGFTKNISLYIKGYNLTDEKYFIDQGYPSPGLYILSGIKFNL